MFYLRPDRWRDQPSEPVYLDRSHPLGVDCLIAMIHSPHHWGRNLAGGGNLGRVGVPRMKACPSGIGLDQTYSGNNGFELAAMPKHWEINSSTPGTRGQTASARIFTVGAPSGFNVAINSSAKGNGTVAPWVGGVSLEVSTNAAVDASRVSVAMQYANGFYREEYTGQRIAGRTQVFSYAADHVAGQGRWCVGGLRTDTTNPYVTAGTITWDATNKFAVGQGSNGTANIVMLDFLFYRRPLTADELLWREEEPYAMFRPLLRRQYHFANTNAPEFSGDLSGSGVANGDLSTEIRLSGDTTASGTATADLSASITISGATTGAGTAASDLSTEITLAAAATGAGTTSADLSTSIALAADATGAGTAAGALSTSILLAADATASGSASGDISGASNFAADVTGTGTASADLSTAITASADATASGTAAADLSAAITLATDATASGVAMGDLSGAASFFADVTSTGAAAGDLSTEIRLAGDASATGAATAGLDAGSNFSAAAVASGVALADLLNAIRMSADAIVVGTTSGDLLVGALVAASSRRARSRGGPRVMSRGGPVYRSR